MNEIPEPESNVKDKDQNISKPIAKSDANLTPIG